MTDRSSLKIVEVVVTFMLLMSVVNAQQQNIEDIKVGVYLPSPLKGIVLDIDEVNGSVLMSSPFPQVLPNMTVLLYNLSKNDLKKIVQGQERQYTGKVLSLTPIDLALLNPYTNIGVKALKTIPVIKTVLEMAKAEKLPQLFSKNIAEISKIYAGFLVLEINESKIVDTQKLNTTPTLSGFNLFGLICVFSTIYIFKKLMRKK